MGVSDRKVLFALRSKLLVHSSYLGHTTNTMYTPAHRKNTLSLAWGIPTPYSFAFRKNSSWVFDLLEPEGFLRRTVIQPP